MVLHRFYVESMKKLNFYEYKFKTLFYFLLTFCVRYLINLTYVKGTFLGF